jgi:hypothetical protein
MTAIQILKKLFVSKVACKLLVPIYAIKGRYPWWALTPDDPTSPFGQYEPTVREVYEAFGRYVGDVYWLAWRNSGFGYAYSQKPAWLKDPSIRYRDLQIYRDEELNTIILRSPDGTILRERTIRLGPLYLIYGHRLKPIWDAYCEEIKQEQQGLPLLGRPLKHPNMDGRPIISIRTARTL